MKIILFLTLIFSLTLSVITQATTVPYQDFNALVDESDHVVGGVVRKISAKKYDNGEIYTTVLLKKAYLIGLSGRRDLPKPAVIRYKGGEIKTKDLEGREFVEGLFIDGSPELKVGQSVILFIDNNGVADMPIFGWQQGIFFVDDKESIHDAQHRPVVGLDGANVVINTENGLVSAHKPFDNRKFSNSGKQPTLIKSEGGQDFVVTNKEANEITLNKIKSYSAMHVSNFVSIIMERKAMKGIRDKDPKSLFTLPPINNKLNTSVNHIGKLVKPTSTKVKNTKPVLPLRNPKIKHTHDEH